MRVLSITAAIALGALTLAVAPSAASADVVSEANTVEQILGSTDYNGGSHAEILRLYQAIFGRYPDVNGAKYWIDVNNQGHGVIAIAGYMSTSQEWANSYAGSTNAEFVTTVYSNVLGHDYDQDGYDYWLSLVNTGDLARPDMVFYVTANPEFLNRFPFSPTSPTASPVVEDFAATCSDRREDGQALKAAYLLDPAISAAPIWADVAGSFERAISLFHVLAANCGNEWARRLGGNADQSMDLVGLTFRMMDSASAVATGISEHIPWDTPPPPPPPLNVDSLGTAISTAVSTGDFAPISPYVTTSSTLEGLKSLHHEQSAISEPSNCNRQPTRPEILCIIRITGSNGFSLPGQMIFRESDAGIFLKSFFIFAD